MRRTVALILTLILLVLPFGSIAFATEQKEVFDDGSYITVSFFDNPVDDEAEESEDAVSGILALIKRIINKILEFFTGKKSEDKEHTTVRTKYVTYYDKNGVMLWEVYLRGEFKYNGEKSECTCADIYYLIEDSDWEMSDCKATRSGSEARGEFRIRQYKLGVPLKTVEKTFTITCDKNGNVK